MSIPVIFQTTKIYEFDDAAPDPVIVDHHYRNLTITIEALDLSGHAVPNPTAAQMLDLSTYFLPELQAASPTGTVTLAATPPLSFTEYAIPSGSINLASPSFLSLTTPLRQLHPTLTTLAACTHVAISITGYIS